jgi:hypothetical protein
MKCKAIRALQLVLGLILFSAGGAHDSGFDLMVRLCREHVIIPSYRNSPLGRGRWPETHHPASRDR